ncbi:MAG: bifunctional oligoribonuclease/PAP phosphatase NrnA [Roseburia sp.]
MTLEEQLEGAVTVAIAGHVRPDGDCVGSTLAVYNYIKMYSPDIQVDLMLEPIPNIFKFLKNADKIDSEYNSQKIYDLFIALDCGDLGRLGNAASYFSGAKRTFCIDHHMSNQCFADVNYIYPDASSTCELVFDLMDEDKITKEIAECLYVGMVHDTGVFQYSCTSSKTMNIAGRLMDKGIPFSEIVDQTYFQKTYEQNRILGKALVDSKRYLNGQCIVSVVTADDMREYQVLPKHLDGIVQQLRSTKGVDTSIFIYENEDGSYKVSMRSGGLVDVATLLMQYGGGGHKRAAGATMHQPPEELIPMLVEQVEKQLLIRESGKQ